MAAYFLSLLFSLLIFSISANGRSLQKNYTSENTDFSHFSSFATDKYTGKTNYSDVLGLINLCTQFPSLVEQNDDPCLPPKWTWIECNSEPIPRIIALNLNSKLLWGEIPDFSTMDALQTIDLSENSLYGLVPPFLGTFPDLQELNLAYNALLYGLVPDSLACNKNLKIIVTGVAGLYASDKCATSSKTPSPTTSSNSGGTSFQVPETDSDSSGTSFQAPATRSRKKGSKLPVILGSSGSVFGVFWIAVGIFAIYQHKAKAAAAITEASQKQGPTDPNIPAEERPMNAGPNDMSP